MNLVVVLLILVLVFGTGGYYSGGPVFAGGSIGLVLLIVLVLYLLGYLR